MKKKRDRKRNLRRTDDEIGFRGYRVPHMSTSICFCTHKQSVERVSYVGVRCLRGVSHGQHKQKTRWERQVGLCVNEKNSPL